MSVDLSIHNVTKVELGPTVTHSSNGQDYELTTRDILITHQNGQVFTLALFTHSDNQPLEVSV
jgi:hypothetical protein